MANTVEQARICEALKMLIALNIFIYSFHVTMIIEVEDWIGYVSLMHLVSLVC